MITLGQSFFFCNFAVINSVVCFLDALRVFNMVQIFFYRFLNIVLYLKSSNEYFNLYTKLLDNYRTNPIKCPVRIAFHKREVSFFILEGEGGGGG